MTDKPSVTLPAVVEKVIDSPHPGQPQKAQISIQNGAEPLYKEIRIENTLKKDNGESVKLKEGARVEVIVEATPSGVLPAPKI